MAKRRKAAGRLHDYVADYQVGLALLQEVPSELILPDGFTNTFVPGLLPDTVIAANETLRVRELGMFLVQAGLSGGRDHAWRVFLALNGLRISEALNANIEHLGMERGHRTLTITRKGGRSPPSPSHLAPPLPSTCVLGNVKRDRSS